MVAMIRALSPDGWRYVVDCADGCGMPVVAVMAHVTTARCSACARRHHGVVTVPRLPIAQRAHLALGQHGAAWPRALRVSTEAVSLRKTRVVSAVEVGLDDERVPPAARVLAARVGGRVLVSVARRSDSPTTAVGRASANWARTDTLVGVQWRLGGRRPTWMVVWKNGRRDHVMVGERRMTHTDAGVL
jgi:hypothetical protein